jgi:hypothetical protein
MAQPRRLRSHCAIRRRAVVRQDALGKPIVHAKHFAADFKVAYFFADSLYNTGQFMCRHGSRAARSVLAVRSRIPADFRWNNAGCKDADQQFASYGFGFRGIVINHRGRVGRDQGKAAHQSPRWL